MYDSQVFVEILSENTSKDVYAVDRSKEIELALEMMELSEPCSSERERK